MKRKRLTKVERQQVYEKYDGRCAYCGEKLKYEDMQVDHLDPLWLGGADDMSNYMPSCHICNHCKGSNSLEGFRKMIETIPDKLYRGSYIYRVGFLYELIVPYRDPVTFHFERKEQV